MPLAAFQLPVLAKWVSQPGELERQGEYPPSLEEVVSWGQAMQ
jgi:hypothetical protein